MVAAQHQQVMGPRLLVGLPLGPLHIGLTHSLPSVTPQDGPIAASSAAMPAATSRYASPRPTSAAPAWVPPPGLCPPAPLPDVRAPGHCLPWVARVPAPAARP